MRASFLARSFAALAIAVSVCSPAFTQSIVGKGKTGPVPDPINLDAQGLFQDKFVSVGDDMFIAGQPTEKGLRELHAKGVNTVVNLRMPEEMARVEFDEAALVKELGMKYVYIPMRGTAANPYGPKQLDAFAAALDAADGKVLLHCTIAWRASHLWAAYLIRERHVPVETALAQTRRINLMDDMRMGGDQQPLEGFLGQPVPQMGHPKPGAMGGSAGQTPPAPSATQPATPPAPPRPTPPTRDPKTPGYVQARELPDGTLPPPDAEGNFIVGPTHAPAPEATEQEGVPRGTICTFEMSSAESQIYPGIARTPGTFGTPDPNDPTALIVTTSHPQPWTRKVAVYVPKGYTAGTAAPFIVGADGPDQILFTALDNLIAQKRVPALVGISIANGSGDAQGSQRGLEYDTMSGRYAEFVQREVLPMVEQRCQVTLTHDPDGRATMGGSSGGSAALIMAWYHPEWYHRVLTYSGTYVNQQWPHNAETPHGAWEFHEHLIPQTAPKPIRLWLEVGDRDLLNPNVMRDEMHDWVLANERMAQALAAKGYHYQFVFVRNAGHTDRVVKQQTLPEALEWLWHGYPH